MEFKQIQELIESVNSSNISKVKIKNGDFEITIKQAFQTEVAVAAPAQPMVQAVAPQAIAATPVTGPQEVSAQEDDSHLITVKSPMIGTFYRSPSPEKGPFVNIGDKIQVGQVLCIVEAMKLFNEIESEVSGKIVKVLIDDATPVEYDQPLFLVDPN